jgi:hypothetical protein
MTRRRSSGRQKKVVVDVAMTTFFSWDNLFQLGLKPQQ